MTNLYTGKPVHYVLNFGPWAGACRPAFVVRINDVATGNVNLQVLLDGTNDDPSGELVAWRTSVLANEKEAAPGTWHEMEGCS